MYRAGDVSALYTEVFHMEFKFKVRKLKVGRNGIEADEVDGMVDLMPWLKWLYKGWKKFLSFLQGY
jgi:hypothetical protein